MTQPVWRALGAVDQLPPSTARLLAVATVVAVVVSTAASLVWGSRRVRVAAVALPGVSVVTFVAATEVNRRATFVPAGSRPVGDLLLRYGAVPSMCLIATMVLAVVVLWPRAWWGKVVSAGVVTALVVAAVLSFQPGQTRRGSGPVWASEVSAARADCTLAPDGRLRLLPIAPPGWRVGLPCSRLLCEV